MPSRQPPPSQRTSGLTTAQVRQRVQAGLVNTPPESPTKSVQRIVLENLFSFFNIIFYIIAGFLIAVGSYGELIFLLVVAANTAIGIIQELHAKKKLDSLSLLSAPRAQVVRDGELTTVYTAQLVQDDLVLLGAGNQISADAMVVSGAVQVNESLLTGESDEVAKGVGSELLSGSFVVSGKCYAVLTRVGAESYAARLTNEAKKSKKSHLPGMMRSLNRLLIAIGILIVPIGGMLFYRQTSLLGLSVKEGVETTAAAVIGMIPEGLYLMVSLALAASVLRLASRNHTLVQDLKCTETLARVDVLCVDKTGTITQPEMVYQKLVPLAQELKVVEDYIYIQHMRFGDRVRYRLDCRADTTTKVPVFLLQPLVENAIQHGLSSQENGGAICVCVRSVQDRLRIAVTDTGCGMTPETQKRIFDKFYQGDPSQATQGNGLGLAIVKRVLELVGGSIAVTSAPGEGSTFTVTLPREGNAPRKEAAEERPGVAARLHGFISR